MKKVKIEVKQYHIDSGTPKNFSCCPIALAVQEVFPHYVVEVGEFDLTLENGTGDCDYEKYLEYELPAEACDFVEQFDSGHYVRPFDFELEI